MVQWVEIARPSSDKCQFARDKIAHAVANRTFDVAKLDLYSGEGRQSCGTRQQINQIEWIVEVVGTDLAYIPKMAIRHLRYA